MDIRAYNRRAWDHQVETGNRWTVPVSDDEIAAAHRGEWGILLTPTRRVPRDWFPPLAGIDLLCLASGGGQQGPLLAAAGARVTVLDNSPRQLAHDRQVADRHDLNLRTVEGDMADLSMFADLEFDLIVHPVSNLFVPDLQPVWGEAFRVLRPGGTLLSGFMNPANYIFDLELADSGGDLVVRYALPYSDLENLPAETLARYLEKGYPLEFSHTLEAQLGGQIGAGFVLTGFYEDNYGPEEQFELATFMPLFIATRALKPMH